MTEKSLINLSLDLVELDLDAEENKELVEQLFNQLSNKVDSYVAVKAFAENQSARFKQEKEFMAAQQAKYEKLIDKLNERALVALDMLGVAKIKSDNGHSISKRKSYSAIIKDPELLPSWAIRTKTVVEPDKKIILDALKAGQDVSGATLKESDYVVIK